MKFLSVSEEFVSKGEAEGEAESHSSETSEVIGIEVVLTALTGVVAKGEESTEGSDREGWNATDKVEGVRGIKSLKVEMVGVPFDGVDSLDFASHLVVSLLMVLFVSGLMVSVSSHVKFSIFNNYKV